MTGAAAPARKSPSRSVSLSEIQAPIKARLDLVFPELQRCVTSDLPMVEQISGHLLRMRGKMFRPTLALLASEVEGKGDKVAITVAAVVELMHLATLVHDDSVDYASVRRGLPTVNALFSHQVSVIMGDFLYSRALKTMGELDDLRVLKTVIGVANQLSLGEMRQIAAAGNVDFAERDYIELIRCKTASLISAGCEAGSLCGAPAYRDAMVKYGDRLGLAFQIADDLLDYTEDQSVTGKPSGHDLKEHKVTLPLIGARPYLSKSARARVEALFAEKSPTDERVAEVIGIVADAGGIEYARNRGAEYAEEAHEAISTLPPSPVSAALADAIVYVMDRRS